MKRMWQQVRSRNQDEGGASLVEYALLLALIAVVCIASVTYFGQQSSSKFNQFGSCWAQAGTGAQPHDFCK